MARPNMASRINTNVRLLFMASLSFELAAFSRPAVWLSMAESSRESEILVTAADAQGQDEVTVRKNWWAEEAGRRKWAGVLVKVLVLTWLQWTKLVVTCSSKVSPSRPLTQNSTW